MAKIIFGFVLAVIGGFITIKGNQIYEVVGPIAWAEEHLGTSGGSRLMYKLIGIGLSLVGFLLMTGLLGSFIIGIFKKFFPGF